MPTTDEVSIDGETAALVNIGDVGVHRYVEDLYFRIYMFAYAFNDEEPELWEEGKPFPQSLVRHANRGGRFNAWNAQFERVTFKRQFHNKITVPLKQWRCTMIRSYACGLPGALEHAAIQLGITENKDMEGSKAMKKLMRPHNALRVKRFGEKPLFHTRQTAPHLFDITGKYCKQDVRTEREAATKLPLLAPKVERQWWWDQIVSDRGIKLDVELCKSAVKIAKERSGQIDQESRALCGYTPRQVAQCRAWVKKQGLDLPDLKAPTVEKAIARKDIKPAIKQLLQLRQEAGKTSVGKYRTALACVCKDGKVRGQRQFYGAHTARYAGRLIQLDNLMRPTMPKKEIGHVVDFVKAGNSDTIKLVYGNVMEVVANATRSILVADRDEELFVADFKSIESRLLAAMSGQQSTLDAWRRNDQGKGADVYVLNACRMFGVTEKWMLSQQRDKYDGLRKWGKDAELTLGYQGAAKPLLGQGEKSGAQFRDIFPIMHKNAGEGTRDKVNWLWGLMGFGHEKDWKAARYVVEQWRKDNFMTVLLWGQLGACSIVAMQHPGKRVKVVVRDPKNRYPHHDTKTSFQYKPDENMLLFHLASGRALRYPYPELHTKKNKKGERVKELKVHVWNNKYKHFDMYTPYGGLFAENGTQGHARDVMVENGERIEPFKFRLLHTIHDELIAAAKRGASLEKFLELAASQLEWYPHAPIAVEGWSGPAYKKG